MLTTTFVTAIAIATVIFFLSGCGYKEGVLVKEPVSYLWFTGNIQEASARIDGQEPFEIKMALDVNQTSSSNADANQKYSSSIKYYSLSPGKHRVVVEKNGQIVADRVLFLGNGNIQEIQVP